MYQHHSTFLLGINEKWYIETCHEYDLILHWVEIKYFLHANNEESEQKPFSVSVSTEQK